MAGQSMSKPHVPNVWAVPLLAGALAAIFGALLW